MPHTGVSTAKRKANRRTRLTISVARRCVSSIEWRCGINSCLSSLGLSSLGSNVAKRLKRRSINDGIFYCHPGGMVGGLFSLVSVALNSSILTPVHFID